MFYPFNFSFAALTCGKKSAKIHGYGFIRFKMKLMFELKENPYLSDPELRNRSHGRG